MNKNHFPHGIGVALITPFHRDGSIDYNGLEKVIEHVIGGGVDYLISLGTTGESVTLSEQELKQILAFTIKITNGRRPIVAGCFGGNNTKKMIDRLHRYDLTGVAAILSSSPSYNKPTQEGIFQHYSILAQESPLPVILYNVPSRTASNVSAETCIRLASASENIIAVKDASSDMLQAAQIAKRAPAHFSLLSGDDITALSLMAVGGQGVISVIGNAFPKQFTDMTHFALDNNFTSAIPVHASLIDVHPLLYVEGNPAGIKSACKILGLCDDYVRLPLRPLTQKTYNLLEKAMDF